MLELQTERLVLRPLSLTDAAPLLAIFSDPEVMKYWDGAPWSSLTQATQFIENAAFDPNHPTHVVLGVYLKETRTLVGKCMLFNSHPKSRRAELGFGLAKSCWGQGLIGEAAAALLQYGFRTLNLNRIEAEIDPDNRGSARVLEKLGFRQEGYLPQRWIISGHVSDSALYGLLAEHWHA
ncbi:GNAT family N-acetyltransferase [Photobacterium atrarenae]|uniref:GNAT family N-acetyltransferase n=1 Tax=Photobacterium atrarenae TaxID=865757 RepID=A0ABY5GJY0_9GAMM|nr:GNAT family N-acetyltransferase [Photobacterium atrarenae]UTV29430.1 GNAT family N-acetyltransferase [Photobacterium atrarenae]